MSTATLASPAAAGAGPSLPPGAASGLAARLGRAHIGLRPDLEVHRHLFRGEPAYVVRDPMTMQSHRLSADDYRIFVQLVAERPLEQTFRVLVDSGELEPDDEERFYRFVLSLHQLAFLNLPVSDDAVLYRRHVFKQRAKRFERWKSFLFMRVPLVHPDAFLHRGMRFVRPLFTRTAFALWLALMLASAVVVTRNFSALAHPVGGLLDYSNLGFMWLTLIVLKVLHELGHAFACKRFGGHVPEMGVYLVMFTPLAYVDASSAWGFSRRRDRLIVSLAGMYVESIVAALALFVWCGTDSSLVARLALNVMVLGSVVTIGLNVNPLMRFDGYYILSDFLEIPNLRQRAEAELSALAKRVALGLESEETHDATPRMRVFLVGFGVLATIYRATVVFSLSVVIATKFLLIGLALGLWYALSALGKAVYDLFVYLWRSPETAPVRRRAHWVGLSVLVFLPLALLSIPVPGSVRAPGELQRAERHVLRADQAGFVRAVEHRAGERVAPGELLVRLESPQIEDQLAEAVAEAESARLRAQAFRETDPARADSEAARARAGEALVRLRRAQLAALDVRAPVDGELVDAPDPERSGHFVQQGEPIATVSKGAWRVRTLLTAHEIAAIEPALGEEVTVRAPSVPGETIPGRIVGISAAGSRAISLASLTHAGGGDIPVTPGPPGRAAIADQPYFEIVVAIDGADALPIRHGMTGQVRFESEAETLGATLWRRLLHVRARVAGQG